MVTLFLRETKRSHLEVLSGEEPQSPRALAERVHQLATDGYRQMAHLLDYEDLLFRVGNVEETLEAQINRAAPNWKIDPAYPMRNNIIEASAFWALHQFAHGTATHSPRADLCGTVEYV